MSAEVSSSELVEKVKRLQADVRGLRSDLEVSQGINRLQNHHLAWTTRVINPFNRAYTIAYDEYKKVLDADDKLRKQQLELAFLGLSLLGGSFLTTILGKMTLKKAAGELAVDYICNNNMEKAFKLAYLVEQNPTAQFIVGKAWDGTGDWMQGQVKSNFMKLADNSSVEPITKPGAMTYAVNDYYGTSTLNLAEALDALYSSKLDSDVKKQKLRQILKSPLCQSPKVKIGAPSKLAKKIELSFYMRMLLASDAHGVRTKSDFGANYYMKHSKITTSPSAPDYPVHTGRHTHHVYYAPIGQNATEKMNQLYRDPEVFTKVKRKDIIHDGIMGNYPDRGVLIEAETVLNQMGKETYDLIKKAYTP